MRVVLVRPEHDFNVGSVCRAMMNFGVSDLWLVDPKCPLAFEAQLFAKKSIEIAKKAPRVRTLAEAIKGYTAIATSGAVWKYARAMKTNIPLEEAAAKPLDLDKVAIVFGSESDGLSLEEMESCPMVATIPTSEEYESMNLSHSVAVVLYEFSKHAKEKREVRTLADPKLVERLSMIFQEGIAHSPSIRFKKNVQKAMDIALKRALLTDREARNMLAAANAYRSGQKELEALNASKKKR